MQNTTKKDGTGSNSDRDSQVERKTSEVEANKQVGNRAHDDKQSRDQCNEEEQHELARDQSNDKQVDPEHVEAEGVDDRAQEREGWQDHEPQSAWTRTDGNQARPRWAMNSKRKRPKWVNEPERAEEAAAEVTETATGTTGGTGAGTATGRVTSGG